LLIQSGFRPDALARLLPKLRADVAGFAQAGDPKDAKAVHRLVLAFARLRRALVGHHGVNAATTALERVLAELPGC